MVGGVISKKPIMPFVRVETYSSPSILDSKIVTYSKLLLASVCCVPSLIAKGSTAAGYPLESNVVTTFLYYIEEKADVICQLFIGCPSQDVLNNLKSLYWIDQEDPLTSWVGVDVVDGLSNYHWFWTSSCGMTPKFEMMRYPMHRNDHACRTPSRHCCPSVSIWVKTFR